MPSNKTLRIAALGTASDFKHSLLPCVIQSTGIDLQWVKPTESDLLILGSFYHELKRYRWIPKPLRPSPSEEGDFLWQHLGGRRTKPMTVFLTGENIRHNVFPTDYSISFDITINTPSHFRLPYWMEMVDWSHEDITGNTNPRYGSLLSLDRLYQPLGKAFLDKPRKAVLFASHLREPRKTLLEVLKKQMDVVEYGKHFDPSIKSHHQSGFQKREVLRNFGYNLCPENGMYPGYYTEKIPEAFMGDSLPISWADSNIAIDFNPNAFINLAPMMASHYAELGEILTSKDRLAGFAQEPLLLQKPSIQPFVHFISEITKKILS
jgi:hypothetical protein